MKYKKVLLKLSGEAFSGASKDGFSDEAIANTVSEVKSALELGIKLAIVVGAGNIWRGAGKKVERVAADYMGMLATIINSIALKDALTKSGVDSVVMSAIEVNRIAENYVSEKALEYLNRGRVVILAGGTGNPYFTTDTTAALRASEIGADVVVKATQVDGVYDDDPKKNRNAKRFEVLAFDEAIEKKLKVMDVSAFSLCRENSLPIIVLDFYRKGNLKKALQGENVGTLVSAGNGRY